MVRAILILFLMGLLAGGRAVGQDSLRLVGEIFHGEKKLSDVNITVKRDSVVDKIYHSREDGQFNFKLPYDSLYTVIFSRRHFMSKSLLVNTSFPDYIKASRQQLVRIQLELIENLGQTEQSSKPLGRIVFSRTTGEFEYQSHYQRNMTTSFEVAGTDFRFADLLNEKEEPEKAGTDQEELQKQNQKVPNGEVQSVSPQKRRYYHKILERRDQFLGKNPDRVDLHKKLPASGEAIKKLDFDTAVSHYSRKGMDVTEVIVNKGDILRVYHRVKHYWGAVFYFRNYRPITKTLYKLETSLSKDQSFSSQTDSTKRASR